MGMSRLGWAGCIGFALPVMASLIVLGETQVHILEHDTKVLAK